MVEHACDPKYKGRGRRIVSSKPAQAKLGRPFLKNKINGLGGIAQVVEHLPIKKVEFNSFCWVSRGLGGEGEGGGGGKGRGRGKVEK
jgi:hypothetical protein